MMPGDSNTSIRSSFAAPMLSPHSSAEASPIPRPEGADEPASEQYGWLAARCMHYFKRYALGDWLTVLLIGIVILITNDLEPYHKPLTEIALADPNINLSFEPSIISNGLLIFLSMVLPLVLMLCIFVCRRKQAGATTELRLWVLAFLMCISLNLLATMFGKKYIGRPRPNFVAYTGYFNGTYSLEHNKRDAFQSFPSGHASSSFAGLGFFSMYLYYNVYCYWRLGSAGGGGILSPEDGFLVADSDVYRRRKEKDRVYSVHDNQIPLLIMLTLPLWMAMYIAFTRVRDHHHNYDDILAGAVLGTGVAFFCYRTMYISRRHEWLAINHAAFILEMRLEREGRERGSGSGADAREMEKGRLGAGAGSSGGRRVVDSNINQRGVSQQLVENAMRQPGASPIVHEHHTQHGQREYNSVPVEVFPADPSPPVPLVADSLRSADVSEHKQPHVRAVDV